MSKQGKAGKAKPVVTPDKKRAKEGRVAQTENFSQTPPISGRQKEKKNK